MSVDVTKGDDSAPLHVSSKCSNLEATKIFVERGAALNNANTYGHTPLHSAAFRGKVEVFRYVTQIVADINIRNVYSYTALHNAAY